jgi:hypothetical protein
MKSSRQVKTVLKYQQEGRREEREESWKRRVQAQCETLYWGRATISLKTPEQCPLILLVWAI